MVNLYKNIYNENINPYEIHHNNLKFILSEFNKSWKEDWQLKGWLNELHHKMIAKKKTCLGVVYS